MNAERITLWGKLLPFPWEAHRAGCLPKCPQANAHSTGTTHDSEACRHLQGYGLIAITETWWESSQKCCNGWIQAMDTGFLGGTARKVRRRNCSVCEAEAGLPAALSRNG